MGKLSQLKGLFKSRSSSAEPNTEDVEVLNLKGDKKLRIRVEKIKEMLRLQGGNGDKYDIFISLRYSESENEAKQLQEALALKGKRAFICEVAPGGDLLDAILQAFEQSKLAIIMGTKTYGQKGTTKFSTKEEMGLIFTEEKPFFLIKMCDRYQELQTRLYLNEDVSYVAWEPGTPLDPKLVDSILDRLGKIEGVEQKPEDGFGSFTMPSGTRYIGMWKDGKPHGLGRQEYYDGSVFEGTFENGMRHGLGKYTYGERSKAPGDVYEGTYVHNNREGQGKYVYSLTGQWAGDSYHGSWKNGSRNGYGTYFYKDGAKYDGQWVNGVKEGQGTYTFANGDVYSGQYKDNKREGYGEYRYKNGDLYRGDWQNNAKHGKGEYLYADGSIYKGQYQEGKANGYGEYYYGSSTAKHGDWYKGNWMDGKKHGDGEYHNMKTRETKTGKWENDQPLFDL